MIRELGGDDVPDQEESAGPPIGLPDEEISTWVDARAFAGQKFDSLAAHASQGDNIFFLRLGREKFADFMGVETFVQVDAVAEQLLPLVIEDDLFAGLRSLTIDE
jgi:hypothetical protein